MFRFQGFLQVCPYGGGPVACMRGAVFIVSATVGLWIFAFGHVFFRRPLVLCRCCEDLERLFLMTQCRTRLVLSLRLHLLARDVHCWLVELWSVRVVGAFSPKASLTTCR